MGRYGESGQEQDHNILAVKEPMNNDQLVVKTKSDQKMTINVVGEDTEKAVNNTGLIKPKKIVRHKILLLAYARSGSSFTGELLSAGPKASYYYEPLFSLRPNGTAIENVLLRDHTQSYLVEQHIQGIFKCSWPLLQQLKNSTFKTVRKRGLECKTSPVRVVKTIRLRRAGLEPWIYQTDIQVVHLVRDPRAMITSIARRPGIWSEALKNS